MSVGQTGITVFRTGGGGAAYINELLATGQITAYERLDDGAVQAGDAKAYTVNALAGTSDIQVAHLADSTLSFTAPNVIASAGNLLVGWAVNDRMLIKGSASNDGEVLVTGVGGAPANLTISAAVNEIAGRVIKAYKVAALSNNIVLDTRTGLTWARYTSNGLALGAASTGTLNWYDVATLFPLHGAAADLQMVVPGNILRIVGGAAELPRYHAGDLLKPGGFANAGNNLAGLYVVSATVVGADLDILTDPGDPPLVAEVAGGARTIGLVTRSIFNYAAGANLAGLGGFTDWRVPNGTTAKSLMNEEAPTAVPNAAAFPGWPAGTFLTSSTATNAVGSAIRAIYSNANLASAVKTSTYLTALVRLGI